MAEIENNTANPDQIWQQLLLLRAQTASTGILHDAQILQLKNWGILGIPFADNIEFSWDNANLKCKRITYNARAKSEFSEAELEFCKKTILPGLERSVHQLLGDDWILEVYLNGDMVFNGNPTE